MSQRVSLANFISALSAFWQSANKKEVLLMKTTQNQSNYHPFKL
jgi:hypothetical protein